MKQDARRNLHQRKRQALRLARKAYFEKLKQPADAATKAGEAKAKSAPKS